MKILGLALLTALAAFAQNPPAHYAWSGDKVHEIRLTFKQADYWAQLVKNYAGTETAAPYLEASIQWGSYNFSSVGVRFKGNSSYSGAQTNKKPFRIKLNEFVKGQKIDGIGAFNLSNMINDPSLVREQLYYEMATALGLKSPRTNYAVLYINNVYFGVYVLGEVENSDFLKNRFGANQDTGNLYKGNIGASFADLGDDKAKYKEVWEKQTNEEADDWSDLIELCRIIDKTPAAELKAKLEPIMDIDSVLTALALDNATVNLDSYVGMGQNFNIYRRPSDKRWVWLVWDPSLAFGALSVGVGGAGGTTSTPVTQLATEYVQAGGAPGGVPGGVPGQPQTGAATRPLATKLWEIPEYKERYRQIYKDLLTRIYNGDRLMTRAKELRAMIRPYVKVDTQLLVSQDAFENALTAPIPSTTPGTPGVPGGGPGGGLSGSVVGLQTLVDGRTAWLKGQFASQIFQNAVLTSNVSTLNVTAAGTTRVSLQYTGVTTPPTWALRATTNNGGSWLTPNITGGGFPGSFDVAVSTKDLPNGAYNGSVNLYLGGAQAVTIPVSLTLGTVTAPTLSAVVNSANYSAATVAPNEIVTVFGANLTTPGLQLTFDGEAAQLIYTAASQLGAVVPSSVSGKTQTTAQLSYGTLKSSTVLKTVNATDPGIFTLNASGTGTGAILNQNASVNGPQNPAAKGSIIAIYLTGGGIDLNGAAPTVRIANQVAELVYAGPAPGAIVGLQQINAKIPADTPSGAQAVTVSVGTATSQGGVTVNVQ